MKKIKRKKHPEGCNCDRLTCYVARIHAEKQEIADLVLSSWYDGVTAPYSIYTIGNKQRIFVSPCQDDTRAIVEVMNSNRWVDTFMVDRRTASYR